MHRLTAALIVILLIVMVVAGFAAQPCGCGCLSALFGCKCTTCSGKPAGETFGGRKSVILFYTPWCPACKSMKPIWEAVKIRMKQEDDTIIFSEHNEDLSPTEFITAYPTIIVYVDRVAYTYQGGPDAQRLYNFILNPIN
jgi:thiol-disulfide isomerase/thioredoxin